MIDHSEPGHVHDTRTAYDTVAAGYADLFHDELAHKTWDRMLLAGFAETVRAQGGGAVADLGCGPGHLAAHLHELGLDVHGVDLSPAMVDLARQRYPHLRFEVGTMTALQAPDASLAGITAWYSTIHLPDALLPTAFAEFRRTLAPGGHVMLAFQVGDESGVRTEAFGHTINLTFYRRQPAHVAALLAEAGLDVRMRHVREPEVFPAAAEKTPQACLLARKP